MSELSQEEIDHLAKLGRLTLSSEEEEKFARELPEILGFVDQLRMVVKSAKAIPRVETTPLAKSRKDEPSAMKLSLEELKRLAPAWRDDQLEVPAVFGEVVDEG